MARRERRGRRGNSSSSPRRSLIWADTVFSEAAITTVQGVDLLAGFRAATGGHQPVGSTVIRTLLVVNGTLTGTGTAVTGARLGLIVESAVGEAEVPDPVAEPYADWAYNTRLLISATAFSDQVKHDVRSKRRMDELTETLWLMISPELGGATNVTVSGHARVLLALP